MLIHPFKPSQLVLSLSPMLFSLTKMKFPPTWLWISHDYNRPKCIEPGNRPHPKSLTLLTYITYFEAFRENCDSYECWLWQSCRHWILMLFVIINFTASLFPNYLVCFSLPFLEIMKRFPQGYYPWQCLLDWSLIISFISKALTHNSFLFPTWKEVVRLEDLQNFRRGCLTPGHKFPCEKNGQYLVSVQYWSWAYENVYDCETICLWKCLWQWLLK